MRFGSVGIVVEKQDDPTYNMPAPYNPTGWITLGGLVSLSLPHDPQVALEYLISLEDAVIKARGAISEAQLSAMRDAAENH